MRAFIYISFFFNTVLTYGQLVNKVIAAPDYQDNQGIAVKWFTEKGVYPLGFEVQRRVANGDWQLLGVTRKQEPDLERLKQMDKTIVQSYAVFYEKSFDYLQTVPSHRAILYLNLSRNDELPQMLGMIYFDETAQQGVIYEYKVNGILLDSQKEIIGVSKPVQTGEFKILAAPDSIVVNRKPDLITLKWYIAETVTVSTVVERSVDGGEFTPMSSLPIYVSKNKDESGEWAYPEVYLADEDIDSASTYSYRFAAVDLFGQLGQFSEVYKLSPVDLIPPPRPEDVLLEVDDRNMTISINWVYDNPPADLAGFKVLGRENVENDPFELSDLLGSESRSASFKVKRTGEYLVSLAAIDNAGNIAESSFSQAKVDDVMPPAAPSDMQISEDSGRYQISWKSPADKDLKGYFIHRYMGNNAPADVADYQILNGKPFAGNIWIDSLGTELSGKLWYAVAAVDSSFNIGGISEPKTFAIPDYTTPATPFLKAPVIDDKGISLYWMQDVDGDLKNWRLFRISESDSIVFNVNPDSTSYTDTKVTAGRSYTYYLCALDQSGLQSDKSNVNEVVAYGVDESIFNGMLPSSLTLKYIKKDKMVKVYWIQKFPEQSLGVIVYKGDKKDDLRPVSGRLKEPLFEDKRVKEGQTNYYQLRTYASNGLNKKSEIKEITIKKEEK